MSGPSGSRGGEVVLFDLDGVLVDSRDAIAGCLNHALREQGFPGKPADVLHPYIGIPLAAAFAELVGRPMESSTVRACVGAYRERYAEVSVRDTRVVDGIPDALGALAFRRLAVATSKPPLFAEPLLEGLGLRGFFEAVIGPDPVTPIETKAATIGTALRLLGAESAVMVGDRALDVVGARANGLDCVGVAWGIGGRAELAAAQAAVILDEPAGLPRAVESLLGSSASVRAAGL